MAKLSPDNHLSGSVLPAYMGFSPYQTPFEVLDRARAAVRGEPREELDSLPADIGSAIEPVILARGLRKLGIDPSQIFHYSEDGALAAKKHPDMELYYSDDGIIELTKPMKIYADESQGITVMNQDGEIDLVGKIILEAKFTTAAKKPDDPQLFRGPIQLQAGMMCHDADYGILLTCYAGRDIEINIFARHQETIGLISNYVQDFEMHMAEGTYPEPSNIEELAWKYNKPDPDQETELDTELATSVQVYQGAVAAIKAAEEHKQEATENLMAAIGNYKIGNVYAPDGKHYKVTWGWRTSKAKPSVLCPHCRGELEAAKPESTVRQKSISVKESK
jgi:hypothetical protein